VLLAEAGGSLATAHVALSSGARTAAVQSSRRFARRDRQSRDKERNETRKERGLVMTERTLRGGATNEFGYVPQA
jgi:hypothetical protein